MVNPYADCFFAGLFAGAVLAGIVAYLISGTMIDAYKTEAIEYGYARHNATTGMWEWVEEE